MSSGIDLLLADHRLVEALFDSFDESGDARFIGLTIASLELHDVAEHAALYPLVDVVVGDVDMVERAANAHSLVKKQIDLIGTLEGPPLVDAFQQLRAMVVAHVADEEQRILPALSAGASARQLEDLGSRILQAKQRVG